MNIFKQRLSDMRIQKAYNKANEKRDAKRQETTRQLDEKVSMLTP